MGLDISIHVNADEDIESNSQTDDLDLFYQHSLSRNFCNLMLRRQAIEGEPELDQIGRLTGVDIHPLYDMEDYPDEGMRDYELFCATTEEEKQHILANFRDRQHVLANNIDKVLAVVTALIHKLASIHNLADLLTDNGHDTLQNSVYFSDFATDKGNGYIGNNFGQDLRNFQRCILYAKERGHTVVYFVYG